VLQSQDHPKHNPAGRKLGSFEYFRVLTDLFGSVSTSVIFPAHLCNFDGDLLEIGPI
jgi:hypothetical protein